jgi:hypothetical protein
LHVNASSTNSPSLGRQLGQDRLPEHTSPPSSKMTFLSAGPLVGLKAWHRASCPRRLICLKRCNSSAPFRPQLAETSELKDSGSRLLGGSVSLASIRSLRCSPTAWEILLRWVHRARRRVPRVPGYPEFWETLDHRLPFKHQDIHVVSRTSSPIPQRFLRPGRDGRDELFVVLTLLIGVWLSSAGTGLMRGPYRQEVLTASGASSVTRWSKC